MLLAMAARAVLWLTQNRNSRRQQQQQQQLNKTQQAEGASAAASVMSLARSHNSSCSTVMMPSQDCAGLCVSYCMRLLSNWRGYITAAAAQL
jgi:transcription initiation factor TFIID subunit TAF12